MIKNTRYLPPIQQNDINKVIERNAFFANHENILVAMMADERKHIRELALRHILAARTIHANQHAESEVGVFKVPQKTIFQADDYTDMKIDHLVRELSYQSQGLSK